MAFVSKLRQDTLRSFSDEFTDEFKTFVEGCKGSINLNHKLIARIPIPIEIIFECEEDLVAYILTFEEVEPLRIILPVIRRVMPTVIANEIIGVQPMSGPTAQIHALKVRYG